MRAALHPFGFLKFAGLYLLIAVPAHALYQEYQLSGSIAKSPGYSFATGQYRLYTNQALLKKDFLGFEYDLDSLYADYAYGFAEILRMGINGKGHVFDYQNLNHIVDSQSGTENKSVSLNSPYAKAQLYVEGRYKALAVRYSAGAQYIELKKRETSNTGLNVTSPGTGFVQQIAFGYWDINQVKPYAFTGIAAFASVEQQRYYTLYQWENSGVPLSSARPEVIVHELHVRAGTQFSEDGVRLMAAARAGATNFALPGQAQDIIQSFSVGGPEARYRRLAGYSFSEFRVPAFGLVNLDAVIRMGGPVNLWLIWDMALFDRAYNAKPFHGGAGLGFIFDLPDGVLGSRSAAFVRFETPFFAAGGERFQVWLGMNGQVF